MQTRRVTRRGRNIATILGQPTSVDIPNGMTTEYTYDTRNRLTAIAHKDGTTVLDGYTYTLSDGGNILRTDQADGSYWEYEYDDRDRLTEAVRSHPGGNIQARYAYTYDAGDNMVSKVEPYLDDFNDGTYTGWTVQQGTWTTSSGYLSDADTTTQVEAISHYGFTDDNYEARYRFRRTSNNTADYTVFFCRYVNSSNCIRVVFYGNGTAQLGQWTGGVLTNLSSNSSVPTTANTWYDVRVVCDGPNISVYRRTGDELETLILSTASAAVTTSDFVTFNNGPSAAYDFDDIRLIGSSLSNTTTFAVNNANELTSMTDPNGTTTFTYDAWGRMTGKARGSYAATYGYRYGDKLQSVTSSFPEEGNVTYEYGGDAKLRTRIAGSASLFRQFDANWILISQIDGSSTLTRTYIQDLLTPVGGVLADLEGENPGSANVRYYFRDNLRSMRRLRDAQKQSHGQFEYGPFVDGLFDSESISRDTYAGFYGDNLCLLYFAPHRCLASTTDRWMTRDPLGMFDGTNAYQYARNRPISLTDPSGLFSIVNPSECCSEQIKKDIENKVQDACNNLDQWITDPALKKCVAKRCQKGKIKCGGRKCRDGQTDGYTLWPLTTNIHICVPDPGGNDDYDDTAIHEWLHTCGYHNMVPHAGDNKPYGDGK